MVSRVLQESHLEYAAERLPKAQRPLPLLHQQQRVLNNRELPVAYRQHHLRKTQFHRLLATAVNMLFALELLFAFLLPLVAALKFDIQAHPGHESASKERCIRNFVAKDQLVVVTATVSGSRGDGQTLNMHVSERQQEKRTRKGKKMPLWASYQLYWGLYVFQVYSDILFL